MALTVALPDAAEPSPSRASLDGLDGINFFNAAMLAGFGPYVAVYLAEQKWTQENIGFVLAPPPMKWAHHPNLRKRPRTPAKGRGSVQRAIRLAFAASGTEALTSSAIYDWAHIRRRLGRRKSMPFGVYSRTLRTLRAMCDPIERVPPHATAGKWLELLKEIAPRVG